MLEYSHSSPQKETSHLFYYHIFPHSVRFLGLFHKCILQSGSALNSWSFNDTPEERAFELGRLLGFHGNDKKKLLEFLKRTSVRDLSIANESLRSVLKKVQVPVLLLQCTSYIQSYRHAPDILAYVRIRNRNEKLLEYDWVESLLMHS